MSAGLGTGLGGIDPAALQNKQQLSDAGGNGGGFGQPHHQQQQQQQQMIGSAQQDAWMSPGDFLDGLGPPASASGAFDSGTASAGGGQDGHVVRLFSLL